MSAPQSPKPNSTPTTQLPNATKAAPAGGIVGAISALFSPKKNAPSSQPVSGGRRRHHSRKNKKTMGKNKKSRRH